MYSCEVHLRSYLLGYAGLPALLFSREFDNAIGVLYAVAYTLKMSYKTDYKIEGFFEYVVPPLKGFWWQDNVDGMDYGNKNFLQIARWEENNR